MKNSNLDHELLIQLICCIFLHRLTTQRITIHQMAIVTEKLESIIKSNPEKTIKEREDLCLNILNSTSMCVGFINAVLGEESSNTSKIDSIAEFIFGDEDFDPVIPNSEGAPALSEAELALLALFAVSLFAITIPIAEFSEILKDLLLFYEEADSSEYKTEIIRLISTIGYSILLGEAGEDTKLFFSLN